MNIEELEDELISAIQMSNHGLSDRRMPSKKSIPILIEIRRKLKEFSEKDLSNA